MSKNGEYFKSLTKQIDEIVANPSPFNYSDIENKIRRFSLLTVIDMSTVSKEDKEELYKLIYKIIELEYKLFDQSQVADSLERSGIDIKAFIEYIANQQDSSIDAFENNLNSLVEYIENSKEEKFENDTMRLNQSIENIRVSNTNIKKYNSKLRKLYLKTKGTRQELLNGRKKLVLRVAGMIIVAVITNHLLKEFTSKDTYIRTDETFSTITNDTVTTKQLEEIPTRDDVSKDPEIIFKHVGPLDEDGNRNCLEITGLKDYGAYLYWYASDEFSYAEDEATMRTLSLKNGDTINTYEQAYNEVIRRTYEYVETEDYLGLRLIAVFLLLSVLWTIDDIIYASHFGKHRKSLRSISENLQSDEYYLNLCLSDLEGELEKVYNEIGNFERLQLLIKKAVDENFYLLDNPDLIEYKIKDLLDSNEIEKGRSYVKKHKKKRHN